MLSGKEKIIPGIAIIILLIGIFSTIYVHATQINTDKITIDGVEYTKDQIFIIANKKTINTVEGEKTGFDLEDLMQKTAGNNYCLTCSEFTIKGKDSYQQTVDWDTMKTGVLTEKGKVYFPDTPKFYWVEDVVEIEVK